MKKLVLVVVAVSMAALAGAGEPAGAKAGGGDYWRMDADEIAKLAESGDPEAQYVHAFGLVRKLEKKSDMAEVVRLLSKSAESGFPPAQGVLGLWLLNGNGVNTNEAAGVEWLRKAADAKPAADDLYMRRTVAEAKCALGLCYRDGRGVEKDGKKAFELFSDAVVDGERRGEAAVALAECYEKGIGVEKDEALAEKMYREVADSADRHSWPHSDNAVGMANEWLWRNGKKDLYGSRYLPVKRGESSPPPPAVCTEPDASAAPLAAPTPRFLPDAQVVFVAFSRPEHPAASARITACFGGDYENLGMGLDELAGAFVGLGLSSTNLRWVAGTVGGISRKRKNWRELGDLEGTPAVAVVASFDKDAKPRKSVRREIKNLVREMPGRTRDEFSRKTPDINEVEGGLPEVGAFDGRIYRLSSQMCFAWPSDPGDILIAVGDDGLVYLSLDAKTLGRAIRLYRGEESGGFEDFAERGPYMFRWAVPDAGALLKRVMSPRTMSEDGSHFFAEGVRILSTLGRFEASAKLTEGGRLKVAARLEVADGKDVEKFAVPLREVVKVMREEIYRLGPAAVLPYWIVGNLRVLADGRAVALETCD